MNIWTLVMIFLAAYLFMQVFMVSRQRGGNNRMMRMLEDFKEEEKFFETANEIISTENKEDLLEKEKVIKLWGEAYHNHDEDFPKTLESIKLETFLGTPGVKKAYEAYEDALFYLYLVIPNHLNSKGKEELQKELSKRLESIEEPLKQTLVQQINKANTQYYKNEGDCGKAFYEKVMDGDYGEWEYSKQLIGFYKGVVAAMLLSLYEKQNEKDKYGDLLPAVEAFAQSALGKRWLEEIHLALPVEETTEEKVEEEKPEEATKEETTEEKE